MWKIDPSEQYDPHSLSYLNSSHLPFNNVKESALARLYSTETELTSVQSLNKRLKLWLQGKPLSHTHPHGEERRGGE